MKKHLLSTLFVSMLFFISTSTAWADEPVTPQYSGGYYGNYSGHAYAGKSYEPYGYYANSYYFDGYSYTPRTYPTYKTYQRSYYSSPYSYNNYSYYQNYNNYYRSYSYYRGSYRGYDCYRY